MTASDIQQKTGLSAQTIMAALVVIFMVLGLIFIIGQRQQDLRKSPTGFDGLPIWLTANDVSAQSFAGGWQLNTNTIGLLVVPLFDTVLSKDRTRPRDKRELLFQQDENDQNLRTLLLKSNMTDGLIVLPKWRTGLRLTGLGHPALLVEQGRVTDVLRALTNSQSDRVERIRQPYSDFEYRSEQGEDLTARLYVAQVFEGIGCTPIIGRVGQMVLGECPLSASKETVLILSDPDLLNNHGLRLGDNAEIAVQFFSTYANEASIVVDYTRSNWLTQDAHTIARDRTWSDLLRFFQPPFSVLWISALLALAVVLWRSGMRFGPVQDSAEGISASTFSAIRARARLMRLSDQDGALLSEYAATRVAATAQSLLGPSHTRHLGDEEALMRHAKRHSPELAEALENSLSGIRVLPAQLDAARAIAVVDDLETLLEKIANDT